MLHRPQCPTGQNSQYANSRLNWLYTITINPTFENFHQRSTPPRCPTTLIYSQKSALKWLYLFMSVASWLLRIFASGLRLCDAQPPPHPMSCINFCASACGFSPAFFPLHFFPCTLFPGSFFPFFCSFRLYTAQPPPHPMSCKPFCASEYGIFLHSHPLKNFPFPRSTPLPNHFLT